MPLSNNSMTGKAPSQLRVLVIDDNPECLQLMSDLLTPVGFDVVTMTSPVKALEKFQSEKENIDLVLLDYFMPHLDGSKTFEVIKQLKPSMKVILFTGAEELRLRQIVARHSFDGCIRKPFRLEHGLRVIREVIATPSPKGKVIGF